MTVHSQPLVPENSNPHGSTLARSLAGRPFEVPVAVSRALDLHFNGYWDYPEACRALAKAKRDGFADAIPAIAASALAALAPVQPQALIDRLTMLGMSMMHGKDPAQVKAWLHETARLLSDLPQDILFTAIDECVKEPGRVFVPTVGEIREKAMEPMRTMERTAARLNRVAKLIEEGADIPPAEPEKSWDWRNQQEVVEPNRCTPEEAAAILAEFGLKGSTAESLTRHLGAPRKPTRADYIAMGVDPATLDRTDSSENMPC